MKQQAPSKAIADEILELYSLLRNKYNVSEGNAKQFSNYLHKFVTDMHQTLIDCVSEATKKWKDESDQLKLKLESEGFNKKLREAEFFSKILDDFKKNKRYGIYKPVIEFLIALERAGFLKKEDVQVILNKRIAALENLTMMSGLKIYEKMTIKGSISDRWS